MLVFLHSHHVMTEPSQFLDDGKGEVFVGVEQIVGEKRVVPRLVLRERAHCEARWTRACTGSENR